jgi:hypothetical protein
VSPAFKGRREPHANHFQRGFDIDHALPDGNCRGFQKDAAPAGEAP